MEIEAWISIIVTAALLHMVKKMYIIGMAIYLKKYA